MRSKSNITGEKREKRNYFTTEKAKDEIKKKKRNIEAWNVPYSIASTKHFNQTSPTLQTFARTDNLPQTPGPWNRLKSSPAFWFEPLAELFACTYRRAWLFSDSPLELGHQFRTIQELGLKCRGQDSFASSLRELFILPFLNYLRKH